MQRTAALGVGGGVDVRSVVFGFVVLLATTLNFGFVLGAIDDPGQHDAYELFAATAVSLVATLLKLGDRSHVGAVHLATSLVADLQLLTTVLIWTVAAVTDHGLTPATTTVMVSLAAGALLANMVSVTLLVTETIPTLNRRSPAQGRRGHGSVNDCVRGRPARAEPTTGIARVRRAARRKVMS